MQKKLDICERKNKNKKRQIQIVKYSKALDVLYNLLFCSMEIQNSLLTLEALKREIQERQKNIARLSKAFAYEDGKADENL
jgi:hypothetical protein